MDRTSSDSGSFRGITEWAKFSPAFTADTEAILARIKNNIRMAVKILRHDNEGEVNLEEGTAQELLSSQYVMLYDLPRILQEVNTELRGNPDYNTGKQQLASMVDDNAAHVGTLIVMLEITGKELARLETVLVQQPDVWGEHERLHGTACGFLCC